MFDQKDNCFSTEGKIFGDLRSYYEVLFETTPNLGRDENKENNKLPIIAGQLAGLLNQRFIPNYPD